MVEQSKSANRHKVIFEAIRQPVPDNSPGLEDSCIAEAPQHPNYNSLSDLKDSVKSNSEIIAQLQKKSLENLILISNLSEERRNLIKYYNKVKDQQYRHEINTAIKMSMEHQPDMKEEFTYEELISIGEKIGVVNVGMSDEEIGLIPETELDVADTCSICLSSGNRGKVLLCSHFFHSECIGQWLKTKKTCPFCMADVIIDKYF